MIIWNDICDQSQSKIKNLELEERVFDWFDKYAAAQKHHEQNLELRPFSSEHNLMYKLAKFLYNETIARTSECMMTFEQDEVDKLLNVLIDFDKFTADYVLNLVSEIGGENVLEAHYFNGIFDITVGLEVVAIYGLNQSKDEYVSNIIKFIEKKFNYARSEKLLLTWEELNTIFDGFEIYSFYDELADEEYDDLVKYWMTSEFTGKVVKILENHYAFSEIQADGLMIDLSSYYAYYS